MGGKPHHEGNWPKYDDAERRAWEMITTTACDRSIAEGVAIRRTRPDGLSNQGSPVDHLAQRTDAASWS